MSSSGDGKPKIKVFRLPKHTPPAERTSRSDSRVQQAGTFKRPSGEQATGPKPGWILDGRYQLEEIIGEGGMAVVWRARHLRLDQSVAIKFLKEGDEEQRERFLREAKVAAAIQHRHVVQVLDFGVSGPWAFMVMEHLVGRPLSDKLVEGGLSSVEALRLTAEVLGGLAAVHDAGMVHRDIKPENIFLVEESSGTYAKIVDFGLSKRIGTARAERLRSVIPTSENLITGTPEYMSPEQARGLQDIDERTDCWSVGVMLFEMLTGEFPYSADAVGDLLFKIIAEDPPRLSEYRPDLGPHIEKLVSFAILRDRDRRYPNARAMRQALLVAVNNTAAEFYEAGKRAEAKMLLRAVSSAYEPGDSGLVFAPVFELDFSDVSDVTRPFLDPSESARQRRQTMGQPLTSDDFAVDIDLGSIAPPPPPASGERAIVTEPDLGQAASPEGPTPPPSSARRTRAVVILGAILLLVAGAGIGAFFLADIVQPKTTAVERELQQPPAAARPTSPSAEPRPSGGAVSPEDPAAGDPVAEDPAAGDPVAEEPAADPAGEAPAEEDPAGEGPVGEDLVGDEAVQDPQATGERPGQAGSAPPMEGEVGAGAGENEAGPAGEAAGEAAAPDVARVTLAPVPPRAQIYLDGVPSRNPVEVPRDGASHLLVVRRPGFRSWSRRVRPESDEVSYRIRWRAAH